MLEIVSTSKLTPSTEKRKLYPYYAGYSEPFVRSILDYMGVTKNDIVLDPWNGSGTTTAMCALSGIPSIGIDINPFMGIVAAVRSTNGPDILAGADVMIERVEHLKTMDAPSSPHELAARFVATVFDAYPDVNRPVIHLIAANAVKQIYKQAKTRNPTWFSSKRMPSITVDGFTLAKHIKRLSQEFSWQHSALAPNVTVTNPQLVTHDFLTYQIPEDVTHVIGSPPYLTRLDYVKKTLPELLYLNEFSDIDIVALRRSMIGSVLTSTDILNGDEDCVQNKDALNILESIHGHKSKASSGYYYRFYRNYLSRLEASVAKIGISNIDTVSIVTQGSYYKEIYVDLPDIVSQMFKAAGFEEDSRFYFASKNSMVSLNTTSFASSQKLPTEVTSIFGRTK